MKKVFPLILILTLGLTACSGPFTPPTPRVTSVDPSPGETGVPTNTSVRAALELPSGGLNVTTLTEETVSLTDASGQPVAATRSLSEDGETLILSPVGDLAVNTTYQFTVDGLEDANGTALEPFESTFTTGGGGFPDPTATLQTDPQEVLLTAGGETSSDTRTVNLINAGDSAVSVSAVTIEGEDASQFSLGDGASGAFSLAAKESVPLEITFDPSNPGPHTATLVIASNDTDNPSLSVPLGGLGVEGQGGDLEPSLQWILDTYGIPVDTGDENPSSTPLVEEATNTLVGEEVAAQRFQKAGSGPVTVEVLAAFGVENDPVLEFGWYEAGDVSTRESLFEIEQTPTLNAQRLDPEVDADLDAEGRVSFDPESAAFGFYSFWPSNRFFSERTVYTEDRLNVFDDAIPHQVRAYPLKEADGSVVPNAYVLATEEFSLGFDYNDIVVIVRNVEPVRSDVDNLIIRSARELPFSDRLVMHRINNLSGRLPICDPETDPNCPCGDPPEDPPADPEQTDPEPLPPACDPDYQPWKRLKYHDTATVEIINIGAEFLQLDLSFSGSNDFVLPNDESTLTLSPGESYDLEVKFVRRNGNKGVFEGTLNLQADGGNTAEIQLAGVFMRAPEAGREVHLEGMVEAFGYTTDVGANSNGGISGSDADSPLAGDEVRSRYWERANSSQSVSVQQLAAFHGCCRSGDVFELVYQGGGSFASFRHAPLNGQTVFPDLYGSNRIAGLTAKPNRPFEIRSAGYSSDWRKGRGVGNLGVRFWPAKDRSGQTIANTYIVAQDNVFNGCGKPIDEGDEDDPGLAANCDYNDNLYLISNIQPAEGE